MFLNIWTYLEKDITMAKFPGYMNFVPLSLLHGTYSSVTSEFMYSLLHPLFYNFWIHYVFQDEVEQGIKVLKAKFQHILLKGCQRKEALTKMLLKDLSALSWFQLR